MGWYYRPDNTCQSLKCTLSYDQDTIHAEKGCVKMCDFCLAASMFLTGHGIKAGTHAYVEIAHFPHFPHFSASSEPGNHLACSLMLPRFWWCTALGNVQFPQGHGFVLYCFQAKLDKTRDKQRKTYKGFLSTHLRCASRESRLKKSDEVVHILWYTFLYSSLIVDISSVVCLCCISCPNSNLSFGTNYLCRFPNWEQNMWSKTHIWSASLTKVCQMLSWWSKNSLHSINICDTVTKVLPLCLVC